MAFQEIKAIHKSKFPDRDFDGEILEIGIKTMNNKKDAIVITVKGADEPMEVTYRGLDEALVGSEINDFYGAGILVSNLSTGYVDKKGGKHPGLGYKVLIDRESKQIQIEPSILHKHAWFKMVNEQTKGGQDGEKTFRDFIIDQIKDAGQTIVAPNTPTSQTSSTPSTLTPELLQKWETFIFENLPDAGLNEQGIQRLLLKLIPDAAVRQPLSDTRRPALAEMVKQKKLNINDKAVYTVAA